jgi:hypothetical protein
VEIARGETPAETRNLPGRASPTRDVSQAPSFQARDELRGHGIRKRRAQVVDVAVGGHQVNAAVVVEVERDDPETDQVPAGAA